MLLFTKLLFCLWSAFHTSVSWWFLSGVWVDSTWDLNPPYSIMHAHNYCYYYFTLLRVFLTSVSWWFLHETEWQQVSRTLLSILAVLNNALVWIVSTRPLIFESSSSSSKAFEIERRALITIGFIITFMFHCFLCSLARPKYLYFLLLSFSFTLWPGISVFVGYLLWKPLLYNERSSTILTIVGWGRGSYFS